MINVKAVFLWHVTDFPFSLFLSVIALAISILKMSVKVKKKRSFAGHRRDLIPLLANDASVKSIFYGAKPISTVRDTWLHKCWSCPIM